MTKKDFKLAASIIKDTYPESSVVKEECIDTFIAFFRKMNPRFDSVKFREACK